MPLETVMLALISSAFSISSVCCVGTDSLPDYGLGWEREFQLKILSCLILSFVFWFQCLSKDIAVLL